MVFEFVCSTIRLAAPELDEAEAARLVNEAVAAARRKHPDFERFLPAMEFLSTIVFTDYQKIPLAEYLEVLYCGVKHADFAKPWREELREQRRAALTVQ